MLRRPAALIVGILLGSVAAASADPVPVTSGFYRLDSGRDGEWVFQGDGLRLQGQGIAEQIAFWQCLACAPGTPLSLSARVTLDQPHHFASSAEVNGTRYPQVYWQGQFLFESGMVPARHGPEQPLTQEAIHSRPFTFTGHLRGFLTPDFNTTPFFTSSLVGAGTAGIWFAPPSPSGSVEVIRVLYDFGEPAPVPEPGTLLLLGSGLAGVIAARRRRRGPQV